MCVFTICSFHLEPLQFHFFSRVKEKESLELSMKHSRRQLGERKMAGSAPEGDAAAGKGLDKSIGTEWQVGYRESKVSG